MLYILYTIYSINFMLIYFEVDCTVKFCQVLLIIIDSSLLIKVIATKVTEAVSAVLVLSVVWQGSLLAGHRTFRTRSGCSTTELPKRFRLTVSKIDSIS